MAKKLKDERKYGKVTGWGYTEKDGKYYLCPSMCDRFNDITSTSEALTGLVRATNAYVEEQLKQLSIKRNRLWKELADDLVMDKTKEWVYIGIEGCIQEKKKEELK